MTQPLAERRKRARAISRELAKVFPQAKCALSYETPLQLLVATILSAQCTDERVNKVTPALFRAYPDAQAFAKAKLADLENAIRTTGFFRNKAKNIQACCQAIVDQHGGEPPHTMEELIQLAGVARKTANVLLGNAFGVPGIAVDTHMIRLSNRMGLTENTDPVKIERDLYELLPPSEWVDFNHRMIHHGRKTCSARKPLCDGCSVAKHCLKIGLNSDPERDD